MEKIEEPNNENNINNENDPYFKWKQHLDELKKDSIKKRLTPDEEKTLVSLIRFSFLSHADLITLNNEPIMDNFKDLIMQGLSARLDTYENANDKNIIINLKPRKYLRKKPEIKNKDIINNQNDINNNVNYNIINNDDNNNNNINMRRIKIEEEPGKINQINKFNDPRNFAYSQQNKKNNFKNFIEEDNSMNNRMNINNDNNKDEMDFDQYEENNNNFNEMNESNSNYLGAEVLNVDEINLMNKKRKKQNHTYPYKSQTQSPIPYSPSPNF